MPAVGMADSVARKLVYGYVRLPDYGERDTFGVGEAVSPAPGSPLDVITIVCTRRSRASDRRGTARRSAPGGAARSAPAARPSGPFRCVAGEGRPLDEVSRSDRLRACLDVRLRAPTAALRTRAAESTQRVARGAEATAVISALGSAPRATLVVVSVRDEVEVPVYQRCEQRDCFMNPLRPVIGSRVVEENWVSMAFRSPDGSETALAVPRAGSVEIPVAFAYRGDDPPEIPALEAIRRSDWASAASLLDAMVAEAGVPPGLDPEDAMQLSFARAVVAARLGDREAFGRALEHIAALESACPRTQDCGVASARLQHLRAIHAGRPTTDPCGQGVPER